jgi:hypothetical protein
MKGKDWIQTEINFATTDVSRNSLDTVCKFLYGTRDRVRLQRLLRPTPEHRVTLSAQRQKNSLPPSTKR